ncbi:hypothetical protein PV682_38560 [Streptomyces niveiscabiei]|uniref:hypothetical protein n=1 Tax=Streptomyces niveiscabiei TaxID=164115 RepID=UPI0029A5996B|nr:hypothetical protein [Streptomyces niveiscabiei]MDX3387304.1 hypothetical protein [Streptomyces niveiscabiei]
MKPIKLVLVVSLSMLALAACGSSGEGNAEPRESSSPSTEEVVVSGTDKISLTGTDPQIVVHDLALAADMSVGGRLAYVEVGKCLVVHGKRAEQEFTMTPVWPEGTEAVLSGGKRGVKVPGFGPVLEGDAITAGGSYLKPGDKRAVASGIDPACRAKDGFIVFNAGTFA